MAANGRSAVVETRPTVCVYVDTAASDRCISSIEFGLEEEGIPCVVEKKQGMSAHELSAVAAKASILGVGVGLVEGAREAALHHRDLPDDIRLIEIKADEFNPDALRRLGANAARFVKNTPLMPILAEALEETEEVDVPIFTPPPMAMADPECNQNIKSAAPTEYAGVDKELLTRTVIEVIKQLYA